MTDPLHPPTLEEMEDWARRAYETIPAVLRCHTEGVVFRIAEFPDEETLRDLGLASPFDLMGLYRGISLRERSVTDSGAEPPLVFLYRRPILDYWCETGEDLIHVVRHVLIHEFGHHFGLSDADMEALEAQAEREETAG